MFSGAELVKASDIQYRDLGNIESEAFSRSYVEQIVRERLGYNPRQRDLDAAIKEALDDLSSGRVLS